MADQKTIDIMNEFDELSGNDSLLCDLAIKIWTEHREYLKSGGKGEDLLIGHKACPFCVVYFDDEIDDCTGCPLEDIGERCLAVNSTYRKVAHILHPKATGHKTDTDIEYRKIDKNKAQIDAAQMMIDILIRAKNARIKQLAKTE